MAMYWHAKGPCRGCCIMKRNTAPEGSVDWKLSFAFWDASPKRLVIAVLRFLDPCSYFETGGKCSWSHWVLLSTDINCGTGSSGEERLGEESLSLGTHCLGALPCMINNRSWTSNWIRELRGYPHQASPHSESPFPYRIKPSSWLWILCCNSGRDGVKITEWR